MDLRTLQVRVGSVQVLYVVAAPSARQPVDRVDLVGPVDLAVG